MAVVNLKKRHKQKGHKSLESFKNCKEDLLPHLEKDCSIFGITRGQYSLLDIVVTIIEKYGDADLSIWTWAIADYEIDAIFSLIDNGLVKSAKLCIDYSTARKHVAMGEKNTSELVIRKWIEKFGSRSVKTVKTHAKISAIKCGDLHFVVRGSMNLNYNPRFEQFDLTEGKEIYDFVTGVENEIPFLDPFGLSESDAIAASRLGDAFDFDQINLFAKVKVWAK